MSQAPRRTKIPGPSVVKTVVCGDSSGCSQFSDVCISAVLFLWGGGGLSSKCFETIPWTTTMKLNPDTAVVHRLSSSQKDRGGLTHPVPYLFLKKQMQFQHH